MNKGQIRSQFLALLDRNDCSNELADTFLEQGLARIQRTLRVPTMEKSITYTTTSTDPGTLLLPLDFLNTKFLYSENTLLEFVDLGRFLGTSETGPCPRVYTRLRDSLKVRAIPAVGTQFTLVYYGEIPDLTSDTSTNFVTSIAPDLLVYGALVYASDYFIDDRKASFEDSFMRTYSELEEQSRMTEMDQSAMSIAPAYNTEY